MVDGPDLCTMCPKTCIQWCRGIATSRSYSTSDSSGTCIGGDQWRVPWQHSQRFDDSIPCVATTSKASISGCANARCSCRGIVDIAQVPTVMPHELFHSLWKSYPRHFESALGAGLEDFWSSVHPEDPRLLRHPMVINKPDWRRRAVPIVIHGDGVRFTQYGNSLISVQWSFCSQLAGDGRTFS